MKSTPGATQCAKSLVSFPHLWRQDCCGQAVVQGTKAPGGWLFQGHTASMWKNWFRNTRLLICALPATGPDTPLTEQLPRSQRALEQGTTSWHYTRLPAHTAVLAGTTRGYLHTEQFLWERGLMGLSGPETSVLSTVPCTRHTLCPLVSQGESLREPTSQPAILPLTLLFSLNWLLLQPPPHLKATTHLPLSGSKRPKF